MSEAPENPIDAVPEVEPSEHVAPETTTQLTPIEEPTSVEVSTPVEPVEAPPPETPAPEVKPTPLPRQTARTTPKPPPPERHTLVTIVSALRALVLTFAAAVIVATIFMWFTTPAFLPLQTRQMLGPVKATAEHNETAPTAIPTPFWFKRIGVVAGHSGIATYGPTRGNEDSGAVCNDGFTEVSVTTKVAQQVVAQLLGRGYTAEVLQEFDMKLDNYQAAAFISIHANACDVYDDGFNHSGFSVTYPFDRDTVRDQDVRLNECVRNNYAGVTGLPFISGSITENMTDYHAFHAVQGGHPGIAPTTPGVILELGLLSYDRDMLQNHTDKLATGIVNGLLCFLEPKAQPALSGGSAPVPTPSS